MGGPEDATGAEMEWDLREDRLRAPPSVAALLGFPSPGLMPVPSRWTDRVHPADHLALRAMMLELLKGTRSELDLELRVRHGSGRWVWIAARGMVSERDAAGRAVRVRGSITDVTAARRHERLLRAMAVSASSEVLGTGFFDHLVQVLAEALEVRFAFIGTLDDAGESVTTLALFDTDRLIPALTYRLEDTPCANTLSRDEIFHVESDLIGRFPKDAMLVPMNAQSYLGKMLVTPEGQRLGLLVVLHDQPIERTPELDSLVRTVAARATSELQRLRAVEALKRQEAELREAQRVARIGSWNHDLVTGRTRRSPEHLAIFGFDPRHDPGQEAVMARVHPEDRQSLLTGLERFVRGELGDTFLNEARLLLPGGEQRTVVVRAVVRRDATGRPLEFAGTSQDVTEERRLQQQLKTAEKLEAIGRLAGGVAHDFNNVLTVIQANVTLLARQPADDDTRETLDDIATAAERAATLVKQLLAFSRPSRGTPTVIDLSDSVSRALRLLQRTLGEEYELVFERASGPVPVLIDPAELDRVLLNLSLNARDAMSGNPPTRPRRLVLRTRQQPPLAVLEVVDTGSGISPEILPRLFEPFFTTKPVGQGTGLGLPSVYATARAAGGDVRIDSQLGEGTTVHVELPLAARPTETVAAAPPTTGTLAGLRVLLVEDDPAVRQTMSRTLDRLGLRVTPAADGAQALEVWQNHPAFDVVVTDVRMPRLGGFELAEQLWRDRPRLPVVFLSGYFDVEPPARPTMKLLMKPVTTSQLHEALTALVGRS